MSGLKKDSHESTDFEVDRLADLIFKSKRPGRKAAIVIFLLLAFVLTVVILHSVSHYILHEMVSNWKASLAAVGFVLIACLVSTFCAYFSVKYVISHRLEQYKSMIGEAADSLNEAIKNIEISTKLAELGKDGTWIVDDKKAQELESQADKEVFVVCCDLDYEEKQEWYEVIANNMQKPSGPTYEYYLVKEESNKDAAVRLRNRLKHTLVGSGLSATDAEARVNSRLIVAYLERSEFPSILFNGLAIYRSHDSTTDRCILYFPSPQWQWNVSLLGGDPAYSKLARTFSSTFQAQVRGLKKATF